MRLLLIAVAAVCCVGIVHGAASVTTRPDSGLTQQPVLTTGLAIKVRAYEFWKSPSHADCWPRADVLLLWHCQPVFLPVETGYSGRT